MATTFCIRPLDWLLLAVYAVLALAVIHLPRAALLRDLRP
jgi:hypothetical protein